MKKTLLIAAAALAAGVISSQAQNVYSQNIVGYANVATPAAGAQYLLSVPFKIGVSNGANEVFGSNLPEFSSVLIWDSGTFSYSFAQTDTSSGTGWSDADYNEVPVPVLPVGQGFFLSPSQANVTNTLVGTIAINVGTSNVMSLPSAGAQYLVGCAVPYAGYVTNGNNSGGGPNLNGLPEFSQVLVWDTGTFSYSFAQTDTSSPTGWSDADYNEVPPPSITVGQGFFVSPSQANAEWKTGL
jgi:hypothetical protein